AAKRVFWKEDRDLTAQLERWRGPRLARLVDKLVGLHRALLADSRNAELLFSQGLAEIARAADQRR
ncbi:MAG: DNA polymerase III subunit delta, partial [Novosphingobium sp.]